MRPDDWEAAAVPPDAGGADPPEPDGWEPVDLPGRPARFAGADAVAYRTRFPDPRDGHPRAEVVLEGAYARTEAWLNGERLGSHDEYFRPARFAVEPAPENELVVRCRRPDDRFGGVFESGLVPGETAAPGVWWDLRVEGRPDPFLADLAVAPRLDEDGAAIDLALTVDAAAAVDDRATLSLRPVGFRGGGTMERLRVEAGAGGRTTVEGSVPVREPRRWWPRDLGGQHRYALRAKLGDSDRTATTGFATVERDDGALVVNGERVRPRGFNVLPGGEPSADVGRAAAANATLLRAHGHVPPPAFYEACEEEGLLVWQDLPLVGPGGFDADRGGEVAAAVAAAVGHRPAVALYTVHAGPTAPPGRGLGGGRLARLRLRWRAWRAGYDRGPAERVAAALPGDAAVLPVAGGPGTSPDAAELFPGWEFGDAGDVDWLLDRWPALGRVVGAFGAGSFADGADPEAEPAGLDPAALAAHGRDGTAASQRSQARTVKRVAERLRLRGVGTVAAFALRDADPDGGMGVLARDGTGKPAYEAVADAFEPVQAVLDGWPAPGGEADLVVVNDTGETVAGELAWTAGARRGEDAFRAEAFERRPVTSVSVPADAGHVALSLDLGGETVTNRYRVG